MADKKVDAKAAVEKLWVRGEKYAAIKLAEESKLKAEDEPEGMDDHRKGLRRSLK